MKYFSGKIEAGAVRRFGGSAIIINEKNKVTVSSWFEYN